MLQSCWLILSVSTLLLAPAAQGQTCAEGRKVEPYDVENEDNPSIFDDLTMTEIRDVTSYLLRQEDLALKDGDQVTIESSYIYILEGLPPTKQEALAFLDRGGPRPVRHAKAIIYRGDLKPPVIQEYKVGPLPEITSHTLLEKSGHTKPEVPYYVRSMTSPPDYAAFDLFIAREMAKVDDVIRRQTGYSYNNCSETCLAWFPGVPGRFEADQRQVWIFINRKLEGPYLHPLGLSFRVNALDLDWESWTIDYVRFKDARYNSMDDLGRTALPDPVPEPVIYDTNDANLFSSLNFRGDPLPSDPPQRGPRSFMPDGRRYEVTGHHVNWQGWDLDLNMRSVVGLQLHDVRFKGERIAYELSLSELGVIYSGGSPSKLHTVFLDSAFLMGMESFELFKGVDCPVDATYFDFAHFFNFKPFLYPNSACVFEWREAIPLRRHFESTHHGGWHFWHGMPDNVLVVRAMVNVYNYDYLLDFTFHQNGQLDVTASLTGYILSSYYHGTQDDKYGFRVAPDNLGQIHNHLLNFKVDLDVIDRKNRFETFEVKVQAVDDDTEPRKTMYAQVMERRLLETETDAAYKFNFDTPKYLIFHNRNHTNAYGNERSYRLIHQGMTKDLLPEAWELGPGFAWAKYQVAVTKRKEEEEFSSSLYNGGDLVSPVVSFQQFVDDNENIVDEDLVAWVTVGAHHIPRSEDIPIVQTPGVQLRFSLQPYNFFDQDPSLASRDNVRATPKQDGGGYDMEYAGVEEEVTCNPAASGGTSTHAHWTSITSFFVACFISMLY